MYTLSKNLKLTAFIFMAVGAILFAVDYYNLPSTTEEVAAMEAAHGDGHGGGHETEATHDNGHGEAAAHGETSSHSEGGHEMTPEEHNEHVLGQYQNKPWSAIYIAAFFFFMIALACLAFYAIQYASQAGWSPLVLRVMEGITAYLLPGSIIMFILLCLSSSHVNHMFHWMAEGITDPDNAHYDKLIDGKSGYLNIPFFLGRAAFFIIGWNLYRYFALKFSKNQDEATDNRWHKKSFKAAAMFLVFFIYTESIMSWDWIMSLDPHWFSTLFGWYVFAGMMVCAITTIALVTIVLKSQGYLKQVNDSHIHDLAKFMFAFSIFWTYLWFSQFMLIWYSNIPEEVTYFITRIEDYNLPFFAMLGMNFVFPLLLLMNSDFKRVNWFVVMAGIVILLGHYVDLFNMVMPATVGKSWSFGFVEIGSLLFFLGLFIFVVFRSLSKRPLEPKRNPLIEESKHFHY
ncbi:quinol:cytochrome C oxidoreductase [Dokdonia pacifica]|uniref:Quinol:cytochrome c oxidoreductase quinone-binding subunit 2 n=1 Tax=Dokdonia pacifica TaxID=1627892 RepID=A0A238VRN2_9FLAO|nr:quinol:cytochrome C oxidoreductase [Dokdonia pacifica]GGG18385.1 quinol:cytochrome C oxidoreductase [Dokdonia pacifica]SNR36896.1 quinol:cytochrome c oxidoreductase quinone-binding subunit 2 [Dokdonia pacifica]